MTPVAVLVHVEDVDKGLEWYKKAFPKAVPIYHSEFDFTVLDLGGVSLEIVQADEKSGGGQKWHGCILVCGQSSGIVESLRSVGCYVISWSHEN